MNKFWKGRGEGGGGGEGPDPAFLFLFHENPASSLFFIAFSNTVFFLILIA